MKDSADCLYNKQIEYCDSAIKLGRPYGHSFAYYDLAMIYDYKGDRKRALKNLNIFMNRKGMCNWFGVGKPEFSNFVNDPEFVRINAEVYRKYLEEHEKMKKWLEERGLL